MTILVFIHDNESGAWAAFSDCLITSDEFDQGESLITPTRLWQGTKKTQNFSEVRLEEKLGLISSNQLFGWENRRLEAKHLLEKVKLTSDRSEVGKLLDSSDLENSYFYAEWSEERHDHTVQLRASPKRTIRRDFGKLTIFAMGSGRKIVDGFKFTASNPLTLGDASDCMQAAIQVLAQFLAEELGGPDSQFYSLGTGGWYKLFYASPTGIRQFRLGFNHWRVNDEGEQVVTDIVVPWQQEGVDFGLAFSVGDDWKLELQFGVGILPLLDDSIPTRNVSVQVLEALRSGDFDGTFHYCWKPDCHRAFFVHEAEPKFEISDNHFEKKAHSRQTLKAVRELLA